MRHQHLHLGLPHRRLLRRPDPPDAGHPDRGGPGEHPPVVPVLPPGRRADGADGLPGTGRHSDLHRHDRQHV